MTTLDSMALQKNHNNCRGIMRPEDSIMTERLSLIQATWNARTLMRGKIARVTTAMRAEITLLAGMRTMTS